MANFVPTWRPKMLPNRGRKPNKSMLKNNTFLALIFEGFGHRFGRVFGRFFGRKMHEKSKNAKLAKTLKIVIFLRENWYFQGFEPFSFERCCRKCSQKSDVFWNIDLEGILGRFWKGFRRPKSLIFTLFSMFFRSHFWSTLGKSKKSTQEAQQDGEDANLVTDSGGPPPPGERKREGIKNLGLHNELGLSDSRAVMGRAYLKAMGLVISHASHTFGGRRIAIPQGTTAAPPFCSMPLW